MNFKNKIILTFFVFLAFILFFNINNVFAFTFTCNNGTSTETIELPDVADEYQSYFDLPYLIYKTSSGKYIVDILADDSSYFFIDEDNLMNWSGTGYRFTYNGSWSYDTDGVVYGRTAYTNYIYYNASIYTDVDKTDVFFLQPVTEIPGIQIPALETAQQIPQAIATTLKILIPVGLIVLSSGLIIYLIKRVIY